MVIVSGSSPLINPSCGPSTSKSPLPMDKLVLKPGRSALVEESCRGPETEIQT